MKPLLKWSCRDLNDGWVMIGVDVDLSSPEQPECMLGMRRAVHPFHFDEAENPVMEFTAVISEMDCRIRKAVGVDAQPHSASRAHAFEALTPEQYRKRLREVTLPDGRTVREP